MAKGIVRSVVKNTSIMMGQYFITSVLSFTLMLFLPRYLGPIEYGRLVLANSIVAILRIFVEFGGSYLVAKSVSRNPNETGQIIVDSTTFRFIISIFAFAAAICFSIIANYPSEVRIVIAIIATGLFWKGAMTVLSASYQGHEKMQYISIGAITENSYMTLFGITALLLGGNVTVIAIISVTSSFLNFSLMAWFSKKIVSFFPKVHWETIKGQLKEGAPYFLLAIFGSIYYRIDLLMLSKMVPEQVVGWYGGGYRLFDVLNFFPVIFTAAVYPVLSRLWGTEEQSHKLTTQRSLEFMMLIGIPVSIGAIAFAKIAVQLIYGLPAYTPSIDILRVLALGLPFLFVDMVIGTTLVASNKQKAQSILALFAIPLNIGLNLFLIPYYQINTGNGGIGAGIATVITEIFIMIVGITLLPPGIFSGFRFPSIWKGVVGGVVMAVFLWAGWTAGIPWFVLAPLSPFVYGGMLLLLRTFNSAEHEYFKSLLTLKNLYSVVSGKSST